MTYKDIISSLEYCAVSVPTKNGAEKATQARIKAMLDSVFTQSAAKSAIFSLNFPDGQWKVLIQRFSRGEWSYWIPDTREQEATLLN